jgi:hypothetical protein
MSRLKSLLRVSGPSTCNTQQVPVQDCRGVAQHTHATQQPLLHVAPPSPCNTQQTTLDEAFEERTAIIEFDGGLPRAEAELLAWEQVQASMQRLSPLEWLARYSPERLPQGYRPEHFPVAKVQPGPQFWEEHERRGRRA